MFLLLALLSSCQQKSDPEAENGTNSPDLPKVLADATPLEFPGFYFKALSSESSGSAVLVELVGQTDRLGVGALVRIETEADTQERRVDLDAGKKGVTNSKFHFGLGESERIQKLSVLWPSGDFYEATDLEVNRHYLVAESSNQGSSPSEARSDKIFEIMELAGSGRHQESLPSSASRLSRPGSGAAVGDVDGDGLDDIYFSGAAGFSGRLCLGTGKGLGKPVTTPFSADAACDDMGAVFFDFDADGDLDLYVVSGHLENERCRQDRLYLNASHGRFSKAPDSMLPEIPFGGTAVAAADFDRDGDLDLFVGGGERSGEDSSSPVNFLLVNDGGKSFAFAVGSTSSVLDSLGLVRGAVWSDIDNDGWIDLISASERGPVNILRNIDGKLANATADSGLGEHFGLWNGISASDLDNDGDIDFAVMNSGADAKPQERIDETTTYESGILINETEPGTSKIRFSFRPLPDIVQAGPAYGTAFTDFDSDGITDLLVMQNFFGSQGKGDGIGQLLRGRGNGEFDPVGAGESGILIPGDARALVAIDFEGDGNNEIIATRIDTTAVVLKRKATSEKHLSVRPVGSEGNSKAIGARVVLKAGERQKALELYAGHGYLSQGAARPAFSFPEAWGDEFELLIRWPDGTHTEEKFDVSKQRGILTIRQDTGLVEHQVAATELPKVERERIWEIEHRGNLLSQRGFSQLSGAFTSDVREEFTSALPEDFKAWLPTKFTGRFSEEGSFEVGRMGNEKLARVGREEFIDWIWKRREKVAGSPKLKLFLMNLSPIDADDLDGRWFVRARMRIWGTSSDGAKPSEEMIFLSAVLTGISPEHLESGGWLEHCVVESSLGGEASGFLMADVTDESGFKVNELHDNWVRGPARPNTGGSFITDFDRDGILDVVIGDIDLENGIALYRGLPGGKFEDQTKEMGLQNVQSGFVCLADFDNDGWVDLLHGWYDVTSRWRIYRNVEGKSFEDMSKVSNLATALTDWLVREEPVGASLADYDGDGLIDLYVSRASLGGAKKGSWIDGKAGPETKNQLIRNLGEWKFEDVTEATNSSAGLRSTFSSTWLDANDDNHPDLYVIHEFGNGVLLLNDGAGKFEEIPLVDEPSDFGSMGVTSGDIDGDGRIDIYVNGMYSKAGTRVMSNLPSGHFERHVTKSLRMLINGSELHRNLGNGKFEREAVDRHIDAVGWGWGVSLADFNGDGWLDLYGTAGFMSLDRARPDG